MRTHTFPSPQHLRACDTICILFLRRCGGARQEIKKHCATLALSETKRHCLGFPSKKGSADSSKAKPRINSCQLSV